MGLLKEAFKSISIKVTLVKVSLWSYRRASHCKGTEHSCFDIFLSH